MTPDAPVIPTMSRRIGLQVSEAVFVPAGPHLRFVFRRRPHGRREALAVPFLALRELPVPRGVEEHAVPEAGAELRDVAILHRSGRIDRRAEDAGEDHDAALARVHAMGERPVDLLVRRHVDVLFDDVDVLVPVLRGRGAPQRGGDLLRLALVGLLDLHADVHAVGDRVDVDVLDARNAGSVQDVPRDAGALHRRHHAVLAERCRQRALETATEDRIAPMRDARDLHGRALGRQVGDVTGVLAERAFQLPRGRIVGDEAFDHDLRGRRHLEIDGLALHQLGGLAAIRAHHVPFAHAGRYRRASEERHDRIPADDARDRHRLATLGILQEVIAPVLAALDQEERSRVGLADHAAVDADVLDASLGIARDDAGERMDVASTLAMQPLRDRELVLVDVLATNDDVLHGTGAHDDRVDPLAILLHAVADDLAIADIFWKPERDGHALAGAEPADEHLRAAARAIALDRFEEQRRAALLEHAARDGAKLTVPVD